VRKHRRVNPDGNIKMRQPRITSHAIPKTGNEEAKKLPQNVKAPIVLALLEIKIHL